jgi:hypothetical protein
MIMCFTVRFPNYAFKPFLHVEEASTPLLRIIVVKINIQHEVMVIPQVIRDTRPVPLTIEVMAVEVVAQTRITEEALLIKVIIPLGTIVVATMVMGSRVSVEGPVNI